MNAGAEQRRAHPWLFTAPYLVLFTAFVLAPTVYRIWISLHDWDYCAPRQALRRLDNYTALFDSDSLATTLLAACGRPRSSPS